MIAGMIGLILTNGLGFFWPGPLLQVTLTDGTVLLGEVDGREGIPAPGTPEHLKRFRMQLKLGNRDLTGTDFRWVDEDCDHAAASIPPDACTSSVANTVRFIGRAVKLARRRTRDRHRQRGRARRPCRRWSTRRTTIATPSAQIERDSSGRRELSHRAGAARGPAPRARAAHAAARCRRPLRRRPPRAPRL